MYTTFCTSVVYSAFLQKCDVVYVFAPGNVHNVAFSQEGYVHDECTKRCVHSDGRAALTQRASPHLLLTGGSITLNSSS